MLSVWWKLGVRYAKYWVPIVGVLLVLLWVYNSGRQAVLDEVATRAMEEFTETTRNIGNAVRSAPSAIDDAREWLRSFSEREY